MDRGYRIAFKYSGHEDDTNIKMAFENRGAEQRKEWINASLNNVPKEQCLYTETTKQITYSDFINVELIVYSKMSNLRAIPVVAEGMKQAQRKVLFTSLTRKTDSQIKIGELAGMVMSKAAYHHGDASLCKTIAHIAQDFVSSNDLNILLPNGQFGSRSGGGMDLASYRHIYTECSKFFDLMNTTNGILNTSMQQSTTVFGYFAAGEVPEAPDATANLQRELLTLI